MKEKGGIIRKALTADESKALDEVFRNAPKAAAFEGAELKQTKDADGSLSFSLSFRQTLKDRLLLGITFLRTSGKVTPEEAAELAEQHAFLQDSIDEFVLKQEGDVHILRTYPKPELLKDEEKKAAFFDKLNGVLNAQHIQGLLRSLFFTPEKRQKRRQKAQTEGVGYSDSILITTSYIEQQLKPKERKKAAQQRLPFAAAQDYAKRTGIQLKTEQDGEEGTLRNFQQYGVNLTAAQDNAVKTILSAFTHSKYKGNTEPQPVTELLPAYAVDNYSSPADELPAWKHIGGTVPRIRLTQAEYLRLAGIEEGGTASVQSERQEAIKALKHLGSEQYVFYWIRPKTERKAQTGKGKRRHYTYEVVKNADGTPQLEEVREVGTLFRVQEVKDTQQPDLLAYYEVTPSAVLLDQLREGYGRRSFVVYPLELERQVQKKTGKRLKKIEGKLLLWLAYKFEEGRRHRQTLKSYGNEAALTKLEGRVLPEVESVDWKELAAELDEPESQLKKKPKQVHKRLQAAYEIAVQAGFLTKYERGGDGTDRLYYNAEAFKPAQTDAEALKV